MVRKNDDSRTAKVSRRTNETKVDLSINLDGSGRASVATGVGFFDHMLDLLARHSLIDLDVKAQGDLHVDQHHTVEDVGLVLGQALEKALGDKRGIHRYGSATVPMDESLATVTVDLSGRPAFVFNVKFPGDAIGAFPAELVEEFLKGFATSAKLNLHVNVPYGTNNHHISEAVFKGLARALRQAVEIDRRRADDVPSTKGSLT
jgi:imidazoleglycerol-phosphate dehydratase